MLYNFFKIFSYGNINLFEKNNVCQTKKNYTLYFSIINLSHSVCVPRDEYEFSSRSKSMFVNLNLCVERHIERRNYFLKNTFLYLVWENQTYFHVSLGSQWILTWTSFLVWVCKKWSKCASIQALWGYGDVKVNISTKIFVRYVPVEKFADSCIWSCQIVKIGEFGLHLNTKVVDVFKYIQ